MCWVVEDARTYLGAAMGVRIGLIRLVEVVGVDGLPFGEMIGVEWVEALEH